VLKPSLAGIRDMGFREALIFAPLVAMTLIIGVAPKPVLDMSSASVAQLLNQYNQAVAPIKRAEAERNAQKQVLNTAADAARSVAR
jgi:NADH-quinone oxidoreductase subunit M